MEKPSTPSTDLPGLLANAEQAAAAGRQDEVFVLYGHILTQSPDNLTALKGAARALLALRRLDDSAQAWRAALDVAPDDPEIQFQCGVTHFRRGEMKTAREFFDSARCVAPAHYGALGMNVLSRLYDADEDPAVLWRAQQDWAAQRVPSPFLSHPAAGQDPERPLRIGYLSSGFRAHSVGFNMLPIFQRFDRARFTIHAYAEVAHPDAAT